MKILLINKFHYYRGGAEMYYLSLGESLKALGHDVIYFSIQHEQNVPCAQDAYFVRNVDYQKKQGIAQRMRDAISLIYSREAKRKIELLIKNEKPDVAHLNGVHRQITLSICDALSKAGVPMVQTMHDLIAVCPCYTMLSPQGICEDCMNGSFLPCIKKRCIRGSRMKSVLGYVEAKFLRARRSYDTIHRYICPSRFYQQKLQESGFTSRPIEYLCNFLPKDVVMEQELQNDGFLLFFGRLSKEKGILTLIDALAQIPEAERPQLHIAGEGPQREEILAAIHEHNMGNWVMLLGYLGKTKMQEELACCTAVTLPSEWYENGPYSIAEAMAMGKPVIGSRIGGIPEMIDDGSTGYLFEATNALDLAGVIRTLYALSPEKYDIMCSAARAKATDMFDWRKHTDSVLDYYEQAIGFTRSESLG